MSSSSELKLDDTGTAIVPILACVLNQLCARNDRLGIPDASQSQSGISKFHALRPPAIGIRDYLHRIAKYACCSGECFVLALVYVDRLIQTNPNFVVNSLNIHRLLITSIMLAAKFFDDQYYNNAYYAKVGGVATSEVNSLEVEFLFLANFSLFVTADTYQQYYSELCNHADNPTNSCQCSQGPRVPPLAIPTLSPGVLVFANSTIDVATSNILRDPERDLFTFVRKPLAMIEAESNPNWNFFSIPTDEEMDAHGTFRGREETKSNQQTQPNPAIMSNSSLSSSSLSAADSHPAAAVPLSAAQSTRSFPLAGGLATAGNSSSAALMSSSGTPVNAGAIGTSVRARASMIGAIQSTMTKVQPPSPQDVVMTSPNEKRK